MSLYRCEACGSKNVSTDSRAGGIAYNYAKGAIGTIALGAGGAVAGLTSKMQTVYVCRDCGATLDHCMPNEIKNYIDMCVISTDARKIAGPYGLDWDFLRKKYNNIESGFADSVISYEKEREAKIVSQNASEAITRTDFDKAYDMVFQASKKIESLSYAKAKSNSAEEKPLDWFMAWRSSIKTVIENLSIFLPPPLPEEYRGHKTYCIEEWFYEYIALEIEAETGKPFVYCTSTMDLLQKYEDRTSCISTFIKTYSHEADFSNMSSMFSFYNHPISRKYPGSGFISKHFHRWMTWCLQCFYFANTMSRMNCDTKEKVVDYYYYPRYTVHEGKLGYLEGYGIEAYFKRYPSKKEEYDKMIADRKALIKAAADQEKAAIEWRKNYYYAEESINTQQQNISEVNTQIAQLKKKIFGKKKAQQQIAELEAKASDYRETIKELEKSMNELSSNKITEITIEDEKDFYAGLLKKFDFFLVWNWV